MEYADVAVAAWLSWLLASPAAKLAFDQVRSTGGVSSKVSAPVNNSPRAPLLFPTGAIDCSCLLAVCPPWWGVFENVLPL
jgi:hypothetical protein